MTPPPPRFRRFVAGGAASVASSSDMANGLFGSAGRGAPWRSCVDNTISGLVLVAAPLIAVPAGAGAPAQDRFALGTLHLGRRRLGDFQRLLTTGAWSGRHGRDSSRSLCSVDGRVKGTENPKIHGPPWACQCFLAEVAADVEARRGQGAAGGLFDRRQSGAKGRQLLPKLRLGQEQVKRRGPERSARLGLGN